MCPRAFTCALKPVISPYFALKILISYKTRKLEIIGLFLRVFGISSLDELPATEALAVAAELEAQQKVEEQAEPAEQTEQAAEEQE